MTSLTRCSFGPDLSCTGEVILQKNNVFFCQFLPEKDHKFETYRFFLDARAHFPFFCQKDFNMTIIEDITNNKIETLHLDGTPDEYFGKPSEFVDAMAANTSITKVFFEKDFIACLKGDDRAAIVSAVGKLPNVESVELKDSLLMIGICVTNLVKNAKKLSSLSMDHCVLQGLPEDYELLEAAIKGNSAVKELTIGECTPTSDEVDIKTVCSGLTDIKINISVANAA